MWPASAQRKELLGVPESPRPQRVGGGHQKPSRGLGFHAVRKTCLSFRSAHNLCQLGARGFLPVFAKLSTMPPNLSIKPTMRHLALLVYTVISVPHCGLFNRWAQLVPLARTSLLSEQISDRAVENLRRFGGAATQKFVCVRNWEHGALCGILAARLSKWSRKRMQPASFRNPAIE